MITCFFDVLCIVISRCAKFGKCETDSKYDGQVDPTVINILNCDGR